MAVDLSTTNVYRHDKIVGDDTFTLAADEKLVVKIGPASAMVDILNEKVPNNKSWEVTVFVEIIETSV